MRDHMQEYIEAYREVFQKESARRAEALKLNEEVANLGVDVIERGARKLLAQQNVNIEELEESNEQLSTRLAERVRTIDSRLSEAPEEFEADRQRRVLMMQQVACSQHRNDCLWTPPLVIFTDIPVPCHDGCQVEVDYDTSLGRVYPILVVRGTGWDHLRSGEIYCEYIWAFRTSRTGRYLVNPCLEFHGRIVQAREYHCYSDSSGTGWDYQLRIGHSQPEGPVTSPIFTDMEGSLPRVPGALRYDGFRWPNYMPYLAGGFLTYIYVGLHFRASARSRYATVNFNFGDPRGENFIAMPWLCYLPPGEWP